MKKTALITVSLIFVFICSCKEKESVRIDERSDVKTFTRRKRKEFEFRVGKKDEFHSMSSFEGTRKKTLTDFGKQHESPPVMTLEQADAEKIIKFPNAPIPKFFIFNNKAIEMQAYPFDYENDIGALKKLYNTHQLKTVVNSRMSEIEKLTALMVYTNRFLDGGRLPTTQERKTISGPSAEIITKLRLEKGIGGTSEEYAVLFCQLSLACGFNSRIIGMHTFDEKGNFLTNDVCEVYLNTYDKWTAFDPYNRATYYLRNNMPLSALEIRNIMLQNRYREIITKSGIGDFTDIVSVREKILPRYEYIYMWRMNDILGKSEGDAVLPWQALYKYHLVWEDSYAPVSDGGFERFYKFTDSDNPDYPLDGVNYVTHEKPDFYWCLNHTEMHIQRTGPETLRIYFDTMTPNFDRYVFLLDGKYIKVENNIDIQSLTGDFSLRSANKFGVLGPRSLINTIL